MLTTVRRCASMMTLWREARWISFPRPFPEDSLTRAHWMQRPTKYHKRQRIEVSHCRISNTPSTLIKLKLIHSPNPLSKPTPSPSYLTPESPPSKCRGAPNCCNQLKGVEKPGWKTGIHSGTSATAPGTYLQLSIGCTSYEIGIPRTLKVCFRTRTIPS